MILAIALLKRLHSASSEVQPTTAYSYNFTKMTEASPAQSSNGPHPLQFKWTLWHDVSLGKGKAQYAANLRQVASFDTVEDFWAYVINLSFIDYFGIYSYFPLFMNRFRRKTIEPNLF